MEKIKILIVDDHAIVRKGIAALLGTEAAFELVGEAEDGKQAIAKVGQLNPDVVLMDLIMPRMNGIEATSQINCLHPETRILVLTSFAEDDKVFPAIKAGAMGYLLKDSSPEDLIIAIKQIYRGEASLHPTIARKLISEINQEKKDVEITTEQILTEREIEVLILIARGLSNQAIAQQLYLSDTTVRFHVSNILSKLHLANRTQAVLYALKEGIAQLE